MNIRLANQQDQQAVQQLWAYCFEKPGEPFFDWYFADCYRAEHTLVCEQQGQLLASLQFRPTVLHVRGADVSAAYIVGVMVHPAVRGHGLMQSLLREVLLYMRRRGQYLSILKPIVPGLYYRCGWHICYHHLQYNLAAQDLTAAIKAHRELPGTELQVQRHVSDVTPLQTVYQTFMGRKHGYMVRSMQSWRELLQDHELDGGYVCLLMVNGAANGYILYRMVDDKLMVRELAYTNAAGYNTLLHFLQGHGSQAKWIEYQAPADDHLYCRLTDVGRSLHFVPFMSARITDPLLLLPQLCFDCGDMTLALSLIDELQPQEPLDVIVQIERGHATVQPATGADTEVTLSFGWLTQLVLGAQSIDQLQAAGCSCSEATAAKLRSCFAPCCNYISELF